IQTMYSGSGVSTGIEFIDNLLDRGGITFMLDVILLIILALGVGGLLQTIGAFKVIGDIFSRWATSTGSLTSTTLLASFFGVFFGGAAYVSLLTGTKITEENYNRQGVSRTLLSRNVEAGGTVTTPMVPWSDGGVFMATTLGVATIAYLPFFWYGFLGILISLIYGYEGLTENVQHYLDLKVAGIIIVGSTGEFASLDDDEKEKIITQVSEQVKGSDTKLLVGIADERTDKVIEYAKFVEEKGADGHLL